MFSLDAPVLAYLHTAMGLDIRDSKNNMLLCLGTRLQVTCELSSSRVLKAVEDLYLAVEPRPVRRILRLAFKGCPISDTHREPQL